MKPNLRRIMWINVTQEDIDAGKCKDPNRCMIKVATARAIGVPHGYIKVDATGIAVTRRTDYREKAFMPKTAIANMLRFDKDQGSVKPFRFKVEFHKTSRVYKATEERKAQINHNRRTNNPPSKRKKYDLSKRVAGVAISQELADEMGVS